jgi:hypothetical protein
MTQADNLLNTKYTNNTGAGSTSIKNKFGTDVAIFTIMLVRMLN